MPDTQERQRRQTAYKTTIRELLSGEYVSQEGWNPDYVVGSGGRRISRANLLATIITRLPEESSEYSSVLVDDGTGTMKLRAFGEPSLGSVPEGSLIMVIARVRRFGEERYLTPEIVKTITNPLWFAVRQKELEAEGAFTLPPSEQPRTHQETDITTAERPAPDGSPSLSESIRDAIRARDQGEGVDTGELLAAFGHDKADRTIKRLLEEGEIFELKPGRLKVLE
jgi:hypothetical protein